MMWVLDLGLLGLTSIMLMKGSFAAHLGQQVSFFLSTRIMITNRLPGVWGSKSCHFEVWVKIDLNCTFLPCTGYVRCTLLCTYYIAILGHFWLNLHKGAIYSLNWIAARFLLLFFASRCLTTVCFCRNYLCWRLIFHLGFILRKSLPATDYWRLLVRI